MQLRSLSWAQRRTELAVRPRCLILLKIAAAWWMPKSPALDAEGSASILVMSASYLPNNRGARLGAALTLGAAIAFELQASATVVSRSRLRGRKGAWRSRVTSRRESCVPQG